MIPIRRARRARRPGARRRRLSRRPGAVSLLAALGTSIANVGLPALGRAFDASFQQAQWVVLAYLLAMTSLVVSLGRLGDLLGRRRLKLAGIVFIAASAACAAAPSPGWPWHGPRRAWRGGDDGLVAGLAAELAGKDRAGRVMGMLGAMSAAGTALGPSLGGLLLEAYGWRALFLALLPPGALALGLAWRLPPAARPRTGRVSTARARSCWRRPCWPMRWR